MWSGIKKLMICVIFAAALTAAAACVPAEAEVIAQVTGTDIVAYINNYPVPSYNINGYTAVIASELTNYGFNYRYNDSLRRVDLSYTGSPPSPLAFWRDESTYGEPVADVLATDIEVYLDGVRIDGFNIDGLTAIYFDALRRYGPEYYDDADRILTLTIPGMSMGTFATVPERSQATADIRCDWSSDGRNWECILRIPVAQYDYYSSLPRGGSYEDYLTSGKNTGYIRSLAEMFEDMAQSYGLTAREKLDMVIEFVRSVRYVDDMEAKGVADYVSYPVETIFEQQGDCEDTAILLAGILREMGFDAVLMIFPKDEVGHMAVGVADDGAMSGAAYEHEGKTYYYTDTTEPGWEVGRLPEELTGLTPMIVDLTDSK